MGPIPLCSLGSGDVGAPSSLLLRSMTGGFVFFGTVLDKGTSSLFFTGVSDGYFTGDLCFPFPFVFFIGALGGPDFLMPEGPGCGSLPEVWDSEYLTFSNLRTCFVFNNFSSNSCPELSNQVLSFSEGQIY